MGWGNGRAGRGHAGGIAWLAALVDEHGPAIDYDLMTMTRYTIRDIGGALPWGALLHFIQYLPRDSALSMELVPKDDEELWAEGRASAAILADIYDLIAALNANVCARGSGHRPRTPSQYPRPWRKGNGTKVIGKDPIPVSDFEAWWNS